MLACHVHHTSGHMGKTRTLSKIKERFMWHGMVKAEILLGHKLYIANVYVCVYSVTIMHFGYIRLQFLLIFQLTTCNVCQRMNLKLTSGIPEMHPISVKAPWYMLGIGGPGGGGGGGGGARGPWHPHPLVMAPPPTPPHNPYK